MLILALNVIARGDHEPHRIVGIAATVEFRAHHIRYLVLHEAAVFP